MLVLVFMSGDDMNDGSVVFVVVIGIAFRGREKYDRFEIVIEEFLFFLRFFRSVFFGGSFCFLFGVCVGKYF